MVCGNIWPYTFLPISRGISFTEDLMPLLSTEIYREFASTAQYCRHLLDHSRGKRRFWFACPDDSPELTEFVRSMML